MPGRQNQNPLSTQLYVGMRAPVSLGGVNRRSNAVFGGTGILPVVIPAYVVPRDVDTLDPGSEKLSQN